MPTYVYRFEIDGTEVEETQPITSEPYQFLPHPSGDYPLPLPVKRVPQRPGATFHGEGWARK